MTRQKPPTYIEQGLRQLAMLSSSQTQELLEALKAVQPNISSADLASIIDYRVASISTEVVYGIIRALITIYRIRQEYGFSLAQLFDNIGVDFDRLKLSEEDRRAIRERIPEFLQVEPLATTAKAFNVMSSHEHVYTKARVLTDLRPIFSNDADALPTAFVVVHNLKVSYRQGDETKDVFVALDSSDISALKNVLERAERKASHLISAIKGSNIPVLEVSGDTSGS